MEKSISLRSTQRSNFGCQEGVAAGLDAADSMLDMVAAETDVSADVPNADCCAKQRWGVSARAVR